MSAPLPPPRSATELREELDRRRTGFIPEWPADERGPGAALDAVLARYLAAIGQRLAQTPARQQLALLDTLGARLIPAQAARVPIVFTLAEDAGNSRAPAGTRLAADPPPPDPAGPDPLPVPEPATTMPPGPIAFETERSLGLAAGRLVELWSVWPGRDQAIDHRPALAAGESFRPWERTALEDLPHHLYIAHSTLLALAGSTEIKLDFDLSQGSDEPLAAAWEYWDGEVWRPFANSIALCDRGARDLADRTEGFQRTGAVLLMTDCAETKAKEIGGVTNFWVRARLAEPLLPDPVRRLPEIEQIELASIFEHGIALRQSDEDKSIEIEGGFLPDRAIVDGIEADLTKPFYPFGQQPKPGSVFYFAADELFAKPGANVELCYLRSLTQQDFEASNRERILRPVVAWEYWNGRAWRALPDFADDGVTGTRELDPVGDSGVGLRALRVLPGLSGQVSFTVPDDFEATTVAGIDARWVRVRIVHGSYSYYASVEWRVFEDTQTFSYLVPRPPALADFKLGYRWEYGPFAPEAVLAYNDFQYRNQTEDAIWPGRSFRPFTPPRDLTPALYLGFDKPLPVDHLGFFVDVEEDLADGAGPALIWEHWDGGEWRPLAIEDETRRLRRTGLINLIGPQGSKPLARFGTERSWLRARLKEDGPPGAPVIRRLLPNATWAVQRQTIVDDPIGASDGQPEQVYRFRQAPVLEGERIEVRELAGPRAHVEWRIVALELFPGDRRAIAQIEERLGREGNATDVDYGPLRLRRDRKKQVTEVWVRWEWRADLHRSGSNDRHYALDRATGRLHFGGGAKVPPAGAAIVARRYRTGGGSIGNLPAGAVAQLLGAIGGVESVANPVPAEGGADGETIEALRERGPRTLRHRGRGLTARDLAALAREASPAVAAARALPARAADGRRRAGYVTLVIIPAGREPRPWPSFGLREQVRRYVEARAAATVAGLERIEVTGPSYRPVDVAATIVPLDASEAGAVEQRARAALERLLHPLLGGPDGTGWDPGRAVHRSDIATALERTEGIDYVAELTLSVSGRIGGERVAVAPDEIVVAGELRLRLAGDAGRRAR